MFTKIHDVLTTDRFAPKPANGWLRPIHALDIGNIIAQNVVSGGVRRSSEIALLDPQDSETLEAKLHLVNCPDKYHRFLSNNSVFYEEKPTWEQFHRQFEILKKNGDPCFFNAEAAKKRKPGCAGVNPCGEALLRNKQLCNLVSTNAMSFVKEGRLDKEAFIRAHRLNARAALRMTLIELELPEWEEAHKIDRIQGVSLMGWYDMLDAIGITAGSIGEIKLQRELRLQARDAVHEYAKDLGIDPPELITTMKPEGTLSKIAGAVSPGANRSRAPYYIRRIRIGAYEPLCAAMEALGFKSEPEVGQGAYDGQGNYVPVSTKVLEFPVACIARQTSMNVTALDQLNTYYNFQRNYTEHNTSITIEVAPDEWQAVEQNIWHNWNHVIGVSFLERNTKELPLMPEEAISKEQYESMVANLPTFNSKVLTKFERKLDTKGQDFSLGDDESCSNGACPIR
jgi:ribonucleoside-diphosphate reductase alpha chain/ribonucleoside-triphosphate reductase